MNQILNVDGITCEHCVDTIKEAVGIIVGVFSVDVDYRTKTSCCGIWWKTRETRRFNR